MRLGGAMDTEQWRDRARAFAAELATELTGEHGAGDATDPVRRAAADAVAALSRLADALDTTDVPGATTSGRPAPVEVLVPVLGVDGCSAGWVGALLEPGAPRPRVVVAPTIAE